MSEGDEVKKGDTMATVDKTSLLATLAETQSELDDINKEAKVTATSGTVSSILVSENEYVSEGDNLLKLKGDFQSKEYLSLESEKEDLEEKLAALLKIVKNNTITADSAGIITAVNVSADTENGKLFKCSNNSKWS